MTILDKLVEATKKRIESDKKTVSLDVMIEKAKNVSSKAFAFENALKSEEISFICEVKKASPSKGVISNDFDYVKIATEYEEAGASCVSVLTETDYFLGSDKYLEEIRRAISIPILRKDFTIDPYQIYQAKVLGADAVLLIAALLDTDTLIEYIKIADSLSMSALVEAHTEEEVLSAVKASARIIGVNNRNLKTFEVDLNRSTELRKLVPNNILFISESGITTKDDIKTLKESGVDGVLIGERFMQSNDKKALLQNLRSV